MTIEISSKELLNFLQVAGRTVTPNSVIEMAQNILLDIDHNRITATGTDLENTITTSMEIADTGAHLAIAVPPQLTIDVLRGFPDQPIRLEINEDNMEVVIRSSTGTYQFVARRGDEFPEAAKLEEDSRTVGVPANVLTVGVANAIVSAAKESQRPVMTGIYFNFTEEGLILAATDAHVLTRTSYTTIRTDRPGSFVLPRKSASLLTGLIPENDTYEVAVSFDSKNIIFETPQFTLLCRQIEGNYPKYQAVIPQDNPYEVIVDRESLEGALKRLCSFVVKKDDATVKVNVSNNIMDLESTDVDTGRKGHESLICQYNGDPIFVGFKGIQVLCVLPSIKTTDVKVVLGDSSRAGIFLPTEQKEGEDLLNLVMPLIIN